MGKGKNDKVDLTDAKQAAEFAKGKAAGYREKEEGVLHQYGLVGHTFEGDAFWYGHTAGKSERDVDDKKASVKK